MQDMWPDGMKFDISLLIVNVATPPMKKAEGLSVRCPKLIHVASGTHVLHKVCEPCHVLYSYINKSVTNGKKMSVKSPENMTLYKYCDVPLNSRNIESERASIARQRLGSHVSATIRVVNLSLSG
jgi:hypothetical protein